MSWLWFCRTTSVTLPIPVSTPVKPETNLSDLFKSEALFKDIIYQEPVMLEYRVEELERRLKELENMHKNTLKSLETLENLQKLKSLETLETLEIQENKNENKNENENKIEIVVEDIEDIEDVVVVKDKEEKVDPVLTNFFKTVHAEIDYIEQNLEAPLPAKLIEQLRILSSSACIPIPNSPKLPELR
jgi:hypothetical protein